MSIVETKEFLYFLIIILIGISPATAQEMKFDDAIKLDKSVNTEGEEINPLLSLDGKKLFFSRGFDAQNMGGNIAGLDIWISEKDISGQWLPAHNKIKQWNTKSSNALVGINKDNTVVYLLNSYSKKSGIAFSKLINNQWTTPEIINIPGITRSEFVGYYMNPSFDILLISMTAKESIGQEDLYVCLKDSIGNWSNPKNLGSTINTEGYEISPFLSNDGKRLFFSSSGHKGKGDADIFYSDRLYNSWEAWSVPKNVGDKINSEGFDAYFSIYGDSVAYYSSNKSGGMADIYKAKVAVYTDGIEMTKLFLTPAEVAELLGNVSLDIKFDKNFSTLNASQNELLFYIVNKVITKTDIKFQITINDSISPEMEHKRLTTVSDKLKLLGISSYRIFTGKDKNIKLSPTGEGVLRMSLFK